MSGKVAFWANDEQEALRGLGLLARISYLQVFRWRVNRATGVVGGTGKGAKLSYRAIAEEVGFDPDWGSTKAKWRPRKGELQAALGELERAGLIADAGSSKERGLIKKLLLVPGVQESVQKGNPTGTPQEPHSDEPHHGPHVERHGDPHAKNNPLGNNFSGLSNTDGDMSPTGNDVGNATGNDTRNRTEEISRSPTPQVLINNSSSRAQSNNPRARVELLRAAFAEMQDGGVPRFDTRHLDSPGTTEMLEAFVAAGVTPSDIHAVVDAKWAKTHFRSPTYVRDAVLDRVQQRPRPPTPAQPRIPHWFESQEGIEEHAPTVGVNQADFMNRFREGSGLLDWLPFERAVFKAARTAGDEALRQWLAERQQHEARQARQPQHVSKYADKGKQGTT